jgi:hypothetical protein
MSYEYAQSTCCALARFCWFITVGNVTEAGGLSLSYVPILYYFAAFGFGPQSPLHIAASQSLPHEECRMQTQSLHESAAQFPTLIMQCIRSVLAEVEE